MTDNAGTMSWDYTYDALHRLVSGDHVLVGGITDEESYSYDAVGNRTERIVTKGKFAVTDTLSYEAASNRLDNVSVFTPRVGKIKPSTAVRTLGYSDSGNTATDDKGTGAAWTLDYDNSDRLVSVSDGLGPLGSYVHNALGQRVSKTMGVTTTHYIYDLNGNLIAEADGGTGAVQAGYVWLGSLPLAFIQGGAVYRAHADHLGTPAKLTDAAGAVVWTGNFRPFGERDTGTGGAVAFNLRFPGQYFDQETGLHYNYFRDYDPTTGRYIQSDPIGLGGGWNTYAYVGGNPVMRMDPEGLTPKQIVEMLDLVRRTNGDLNVPGSVIVGPCPNCDGSSDPFTRNVTIDDRFLGDLDCFGLYDLVWVLVHESIHATKPRMDSILRPFDHKDIYDEADWRADIIWDWVVDAKYCGNPECLSANPIITQTASPSEAIWVTTSQN